MASSEQIPTVFDLPSTIHRLLDLQQQRLQAYAQLRLYCEHRL